MVLSVQIVRNYKPFTSTKFVKFVKFIPSISHMYGRVPPNLLTDRQQYYSIMPKFKKQLGNNDKFKKNIYQQNNQKELDNSVHNKDDKESWNEAVPSIEEIAPDEVIIDLHRKARAWMFFHF